MNIGIITLVSTNYGNKFQNYAVETLLKKYGNVDTFAVAETFSLEKSSKNETKLKKLSPQYITRVLRSRMMYQFDITNTSRPLLISLFYVLKNREKLYQIRDKRSKKFEEYQKKYLHISERIIDFENCSDKEWLDKYDYFFCGSDQIWNPSYSTTSSLAFLSFAGKKNTVAIAPSFGVEHIPEKRKEEFSRWISQIYKLSVRETAGQKIIKELTGRESMVLLDPTMAIEAEEWKNMAKKPAGSMPERYILCYFLGCVDKNYQKKIKAYSKKMGLPVVSLFNIEQPDYYVLDPNEVLYAIQKAEIVITDSFHGSVFSILFHKDFVVFERNEGGASMSSRITTLLERFKLTERRNMLANCFCHIEDDKWKEMEEVLLIEKKRTISYIEAALGVK